MLLIILVVVFASLCDVTKSSNDDHSYGVVLFPEPIYDSVGPESKLVSNGSASGQSIRVKIRNFGHVSEDIGFHAYLPGSADVTSFLMKSEGLSYKAKKLHRQVAKEIMTKARKEDHNAAVYIPKTLLDSYDDEVQTAGNTVHIKSRHEMTFELSYSANLLQMATEDEKIQNRARVSLDLYGTKVEDLSAELSSPNYPNSYPNNADITWWVRVPDGKVVSLQIEDLDIEECCDRLVIYDGASIRDHIITEVTGTLTELITRQYQSTSNSMFLRLMSDCSKTYGGFKVTTSAVVAVTTPRPPPINQTVPIFASSIDGCSSTNYLDAYPHNETTLSSPGYPTSYYDNLDCSWRIEAYWNYSVRLTVVEMQLENNFDYVYVYDGPSTSYPLLVRLTSNDSADVYSTGNYIYVRFVTDVSITLKGFSMTYTASYGPPTTTANYPEITATTGPVYCDDNIELHSFDSGHIYSPNYPAYYFSNIQCNWYIHVQDSRYVVYLYVNEMSLGRGDVVTMFDGSSYEMLKSCASYTYCISDSVYSKSSSMSIAFTSDSFYDGRGFDLDYRASYKPQILPNSSICSEVSQLNASSYALTFTSPGYPAHYYDSMDCSWRIYTHYYNHVVQLIVDDMDLQSCCDFLYIYDGSSSSYDIVTVLTGPFNNNSRYYSSGNYMYLSLMTDSSYTRNGFQLRYMAVIPETSSGGYTEEPTTIHPLHTATEVAANTVPGAPNATTISGEACAEGTSISVSGNDDDGYFTSPNFPDNYNRNSQCSWRIYSMNEDFVVRLDIDSFFVERYDEVDFYDGPDQSYPLIFNATYISGPTNRHYYSSGRYMFITFTSDDYYEGSGFAFGFAATYPPPNN